MQRFQVEDKDAIVAACGAIVAEHGNVAVHHGSNGWVYVMTPPEAQAAAERIRAADVERCLSTAMTAPSESLAVALRKAMEADKARAAKRAALQGPGNRKARRRAAALARAAR